MQTYSQKGRGRHKKDVRLCGDCPHGQVYIILDVVYQRQIFCRKLNAWKNPTDECSIKRKRTKQE